MFFLHTKRIAGFNLFSSKDSLDERDNVLSPNFRPEYREHSDDEFLDDDMVYRDLFDPEEKKHQQTHVRTSSRIHPHGHSVTPKKMSPINGLPGASSTALSGDSSVLSLFPLIPNTIYDFRRNVSGERRQPGINLMSAFDSKSESDEEAFGNTLGRDYLGPDYPASDVFGDRQRYLPLATYMSYDPYAIGVDGPGYVNFTNPDYSSPFRTTVIASPLFSKNDIAKKFREIGMFYNALNVFKEEIGDAQITEAMALWADHRFPKKEEKGISVQEYRLTFTKLYAYSDKINSPESVAMVLRAVDALAETLAKHLKEPFANVETPLFPPSLGAALGEALFATDTQAFSWQTLVSALRGPATPSVRLFSDAVVFLGNNEKARNALCSARVHSDPNVGLQVFIQLLQKNLPAKDVRPIFDKLNRAYLLNSEDKRIEAFEAVFSTITDVHLKNNLETALLVLAKIQHSKGASVSQIQAQFSDSFLQGCTVGILTLLLDRGTLREVPDDGDDVGHPNLDALGMRERNLYSSKPSELVLASDSSDLVLGEADVSLLDQSKFLRLLYVPVEAAHLQQTYEVVSQKLTGDVETAQLAYRLGISVATLESRCRAVRHAYAKYTLNTAVLKPEPSVTERLRGYAESGRFRTHRDIAASKYTSAEKSVASKLFDFYFENKTLSPVTKKGDISTLGLSTQETQALYGIASVNKYAFDIVANAAPKMGVLENFLRDMRFLQNNPAVQKLIANHLRLDGSMSRLDNQSFEPWMRFFSATLPGDLSLNTAARATFIATRDSLPSPVRDRIERGLLMSAIVGGGTALNLIGNNAIETEKNTKRALVFEFSRKGAFIFEDKDPGKSKRAEFRTRVVLAFSHTKSEEIKNAFREYVKWNHAAVDALNKSYTELSATLDDDVTSDVAMKTALETIFPLDDNKFGDVGNHSKVDGTHDVSIDSFPNMIDVYMCDSDAVRYRKPAIVERRDSTYRVPLDTGTLSPNNQLGQRHSVVFSGLSKPVSQGPPSIVDGDERSVSSNKWG